MWKLLLDFYHFTFEGLVRELEKDEYHDISETGESDEAKKSVKYLQIGDKAKVRKVLKRILSGDPSKLNPGLTLNHQIANLSYGKWERETT